MGLVNRSYTRSEVEISEGLGGGSRHWDKGSSICSRNHDVITPNDNGI